LNLGKESSAIHSSIFRLLPSPNLASNALSAEQSLRLLDMDDADDAAEFDRLFEVTTTLGDFNNAVKRMAPKSDYLAKMNSDHKLTEKL